MIEIAKKKMYKKIEFKDCLIPKDIW